MRSWLFQKRSNYSNPGRGFRILVETDPSQTVRGMAEDGKNCGFRWFKTYWKGQKAQKVGVLRFERSTDIVTF